MLRRRPTPDPPAPRPEWQRRFDEAAALILSREQPAWVRSRLDELQQALLTASEVAARLEASVQQLDPDRTAAELKHTLRQRTNAGSPAAASDLERRVTTLRERYDAVNDMINRRETIERHMLDTTADVELLAVQAVRAQSIDTDPAHHLDEHLARLDTDLQALELARREVDRL
jgi:hypothetical protein